MSKNKIGLEQRQNSLFLRITVGQKRNNQAVTRTPQPVSHSNQRTQLVLKKINLKPDFDSSQKQERFQEDWRQRTFLSKTAASKKSVVSTGSQTQTQKLPPLPPDLRQCRRIQQKQAKLQLKLEDLIISDLTLGKGLEGSVVEAISLKDGRLIAIKTMQANDQSSSQLQLYLKYDHHSLVKFYGYQKVEDKLLLFLQKMQGGSVEGMLKEFGPFNQTLARKVVKQILVALDYIHSRKIIHRDLKGANVISDGRGNFKLTDLGSARKNKVQALAIESSQNSTSSVKGSFYWMAPQMLLKKHHCRRSDIWSLGCLIIQMLTGSHPWPQCSSFAGYTKLLQEERKPPFPEILSEPGRNFLEGCLKFQSRLRPHVKDLQSHPWMVHDFS